MTDDRLKLQIKAALVIARETVQPLHITADNLWQHIQDWAAKAPDSPQTNEVGERTPASQQASKGETNAQL